MTAEAFGIVFEKMAEMTETSDKAEFSVLAETSRDEYDEMAELRRLSAELATPDVSFFTTT